MMRRARRLALVGWFAIAVLAGGVALAGAKGNFYGWIRAQVSVDPSCPIEPKRVGVQDANSQSLAGQAFTGPNVGEGSGYRADVRYDFQFRAKASGITAVEVAWEALNAFDEVLGERRISFAFKKPVQIEQTKNQAEEGQRIAEGAAKYRVRVTRVAFTDGHTWTEPPAGPQAGE